MLPTLIVASLHQYRPRCDARMCMQRLRKAVSAAPFEERLRNALTQRAATLRELRRKYYASHDRASAEAEQKSAREFIEKLRTEKLGESEPLPESVEECDSVVEATLQEEAVRERGWTASRIACMLRRPSMFSLCMHCSVRIAHNMRVLQLHEGRRARFS